MQTIKHKDIAIISDWQMYKDIGISMRFLDEDYCGGFNKIYLGYSIEQAKKDLLDEDNFAYKRIISYFQSFGFTEKDEFFIYLD